MSIKTEKTDGARNVFKMGKTFSEVQAGGAKNDVKKN